MAHLARDVVGTAGTQNGTLARRDSGSKVVHVLEELEAHLAIQTVDDELAVLKGILGLAAEPRECLVLVRQEKGTDQAMTEVAEVVDHVHVQGQALLVRHVVSHARWLDDLDP